MAEADKIESAAGLKPAGGSKIVPILLVVNMLLVGAVLAVFLTRGSGGGGGGEEKAAAAGEAKGGGEGKAAKGDEAALPGPTQKLADFVVHLRDPEADRYARVSFEVEVGSEEEKNKLAGYMPRVRDAFIAYLSDRTLEELRGSESITRTKAALAERMVQLAPGVHVKGLYVTDLVIQ